MQYNAPLSKTNSDSCFRCSEFLSTLHPTTIHRLIQASSKPSLLNFHHRRITPYWPTTRPTILASVEGKTLKTELAILANYRATPHLSIGIAPNDLIFRSANTCKLPSVGSLEANVDEIAARRLDTERKSKLAQNSFTSKKKPFYKLDCKG